MQDDEGKFRRRRYPSDIGRNADYIRSSDAITPKKRNYSARTTFYYDNCFSGGSIKNPPARISKNRYARLDFGCHNMFTNLLPQNRQR
jgi:hypothetical protein